MPNMMLAVVKPKAAPGAEILEVKVPGFGRTDVLVKVKVASICGTDLHIYEWDRWAQNRIHPPLIPGHEFCGEVVAYGAEVTSVKEGDFVSAEMHVACGKCLQCRTGEAHICQNVKIIGVDADGAFAEYVVIPESKMRAPSWPNEQMARAQMSCSRWRVTLTLFEQLSTSCGVVAVFRSSDSPQDQFRSTFPKTLFLRASRFSASTVAACTSPGIK